jgi:para-nitrobenzyl esterase
MQAAHGLFHKAIVQSSSGGMFLNSQETANRHAYELANALGLKKPTGSELQKIPMEKIIAALNTVAGPFVGVVDDHHFSANPYYPTAPAISAKIPIMAGCTNAEATYYLRKDARNFDLPRENVLSRLMRFLLIDRPRAELILKGYAETYSKLNDSGLLVMITSDYLFKRNTRKIAALHAALNGANVYHYLFDRNTPVEGGKLSSPHTTEVPFIFGTTQAAKAHVGDGTDIASMTQIMMSTWAAFARSGNPNNDTIPEWKTFSEENPNTMVLNVQSHLETDPGESARSLLNGLSYYGYNHPRVSFVTD